MALSMPDLEAVHRKEPVSWLAIWTTLSEVLGDLSDLVST